MVNAIRVLVGATYTVLCDGVQATLVKSQQINFLGSASNSVELLTLCQDERPDVLLLDFHLLKSACETTLQTFKQILPTIKVLALLAEQDNISLPQLKKQGVAGILLKSEPAEKWVEAVITIAQNKWWMSMRLAQAILDAPSPKPGHDLSERQLAIVRLVAAGKTDKEIADLLEIAPRTVRYDLEYIRTSLGVNSRAELAAQAVRLNLLDP
jgi:DNA-binding NarL/FixJ family response regulator